MLVIRLLLDSNNNYKLTQIYWNYIIYCFPKIALKHMFSLLRFDMNLKKYHVQKSYQSIQRYLHIAINIFSC